MDCTISSTGDPRLGLLIKGPNLENLSNDIEFVGFPFDFLEESKQQNS